MLQTIRDKLEGLEVSKSASDQPEAAVLVPITDEETPRLVLTRRASHMSSHAGEVAFPGGKKDHDDRSIVATALRESHEEIGLEPKEVEVIGALSPARSKFGLMVTPIVGIIHPDQNFVPNEEELDRIFTVPLNYFMENEPSHIHEATYEGVTFQVPSFNYQGNIIWGLTAYFIADFMNQIFDTSITIRLRTPQTK